MAIKTLIKYKKRIRIHEFWCYSSTRWRLEAGFSSGHISWINVQICHSPVAGSSTCNAALYVDLAGHRRASDARSCYAIEHSEPRSTRASFGSARSGL
ncbi:Adenine-specific DNA methylase [Pseudomonas syringae pv. actinidiae]|uniref:Adenine-specific DNA methylase n=1 Tax=Pseudomonas syringae pv. actinidiae TaxID=103796 RepID=A0A2V0QTI6_PSESF|nr:Adenine-specific DNA methylase [Pseudomonas syringae pv. actinidiae]